MVWTKKDVPVVGRNLKYESPLIHHVISTNVNGIGTYVFICDETVPKGANVIIEILQRILVDLEEKQ